MSPLILPHTCHVATIRAVDITLYNGPKAAIISCYLPQTVEAHSLTCAALAQLYPTPSHILSLFWEGTSKGDGGKSPRKTHTLLASHTRGGRGSRTPPLLHVNNLDKSHALTISLYEILGASPAK